MFGWTQEKLHQLVTLIGHETAYTGQYIDRQVKFGYSEKATQFKNPKIYDYVFKKLTKKNLLHFM